jgi:hypothetical protein
LRPDWVAQVSRVLAIAARDRGLSLISAIFGKAKT